MSYEKKLMQMKKMVKKAPPVNAEKRLYEKPAAPSYSTRWEEAGLTRIENDYGTVFKYEVVYPKTYKHGAYTLGRLDAAVLRWEESGMPHPYATTLDETLVFFDTETTGLKGAGTYIFLLGFLTQRAEDFLLTQYVLADPAHEAALLFESKLWQRPATIVSYNGKSFDWPQLHVRWTMHQHTIPRLQEPRQIDLLHSSKRLWKNDLAQMKLKKVEEEKLQFVRENDIPGHLAPIIYMDAIKSGEPSALMKVLKHNEWDLLSLVTLYIHSTATLFEETEESVTAYTNVGKWYGDLKAHARSEEVLQHVTTSYAAYETVEAHYYLGLQLKKRRSFSDALTSFLEGRKADNVRISLHSYEEAAKIYEHVDKDMNKALQTTEAALQRLQLDRTLPPRSHAAIQARLEKRKHRLLKKQA